MSFAIVILEVNDMNYDEDRQGIHGFYENTTFAGNTRLKNVSLVSAKQNYEYVRSQSVGGERIRATVSKRQVTPSISERIRDGIYNFIVVHGGGKGLIVGATLVALGFGGANAISTIKKESDYTNAPAVQMVTEADHDNTHRTDDGKNYFIDTIGASQQIQSGIRETQEEPAKVLGAIANEYTTSYEQDEGKEIAEDTYDVDNIDERISSVDPDRYEEGLFDSDFQSDAKNYIISGEQPENNPMDELNQMMEESQEQIISEKGYGGK